MAGEVEQLKDARADCFAYSFLSNCCSALTVDDCNGCKFYKKHRSDINRNEKLRAKLREEN